jgi:endonuclease YncB( thermonuclease family)
MRFAVLLLALATFTLLAGCPRRTSETDAGGEEDAGYDPGLGNGFTGEIVFDDARVMATSPSTLRSGTSQCRAPILARVTRVVDGDTVRITGISEALPEADIRFIGVDCPEVAHMPGDVAECYGNEATVFTNQLNGHVVWLTFDEDCVDPFGRLLAYVHVGAGAGDMWQRQLVRRGFSRAANFPPNSTYASALSADESAAQSEGAGQWTACP